jgi:hypothetical protein
MCPADEFVVMGQGQLTKSESFPTTTTTATLLLLLVALFTPDLDRFVFNGTNRDSPDVAAVSFPQHGTPVPSPPLLSWFRRMV